MAGEDRCIIREVRALDRAAWATMRAALWPEEDADTHARGIDLLLARGDAWGFIAEDASGRAIGFAEIAIRPYANGCDSAPVAFLEGIWVEERSRRRGIGARFKGRTTVVRSTQSFAEVNHALGLGEAPAAMRVL